MSKLHLDRDKIDQAKRIAEEIVSPINQKIERHTTVSIERCVLRLLGVEGSQEKKAKGKAPQGRYPLVNALMDKIGTKRLAKGAGYWFGLAAYHFPQDDPSTLARKIVSGDISLDELKRVSSGDIKRACEKHLNKKIRRLRTVRENRSKRPSFRRQGQPLKYVIVATGNIHEDILQAQVAAEMGADIIAVIRSTAQSLLDYVPEGETTEGFGGTYATQENFRLMREALDETERKLKRKIGLTNYSSGLCMPEIAVLGALEGVDYLLNDAMYGVLFRDINMRRNFIDQHFSRRICALSGITIQTGEDNYLTTADSHKYYHQVLASHFINQAFAKKAGVADYHLALGHAFEIDPWVEDSILLELAQAQLIREIFPRCPIKFMPPTKHKVGDIFFSYLYDGIYNLAGIMTGQSIQLLGMHTEALHNPYVQDRYLSIKSANYLFNGAKSAVDEIYFQPHGKVGRRARQVMDDALRHLTKVRTRGLFRAIEEGAFANVRRSQDMGKGMDGVILKDREYFTPLQSYLTPRKGYGEERRARFGKTDSRARPARPAQGPARGRGRGERTRQASPRRGREVKPRQVAASRRPQKIPVKRRDLSNQKNAAEEALPKTELISVPDKNKEKEAPKAELSEVIALPPPKTKPEPPQVDVDAITETEIKTPTPRVLAKKPVPEEPKVSRTPKETSPPKVPQEKPKKAKLPRRPLPRRELKVKQEEPSLEAENKKETGSKEAVENSRPPRRPLDVKPKETLSSEAGQKPMEVTETIETRSPGRLARRALKVEENNSSSVGQAPKGETEKPKEGPSEKHILERQTVQPKPKPVQDQGASEVPEKKSEPKLGEDGGES